MGLFLGSLVYSIDLHTRSQWALPAVPQGGWLNYPVTEGKLSLNGVSLLGQGHSSWKWQNQDRHPDLCGSRGLTTAPHSPVCWRTLSLSSKLGWHTWPLLESPFHRGTLCFKLWALALGKVTLFPWIPTIPRDPTEPDCPLKPKPQHFLSLSVAGCQVLPSVSSTPYPQNPHKCLSQAVTSLQ